MGFGICQKMSLESDAVRARLRIFRQQPGDGRIASIGCDEEFGLDGFVPGGDLPTRTVLNLEHRIPESYLGARRDGVFYQDVIEKLSTNPTLSSCFVRKLKSNR